MTTTTLTVTSAQQTDVGNYSVAVTDSRGTVTSASAALTVNAVVAFYEDFESGLGNWGTFVSPGTPLTIATSQHQSGTHSAHVAISTDRMYRNLGIEVDGRLRITFWLYDADQTLAFVDVRGYDGAGYITGNLNQLIAAGKYNTTTYPGDSWDITKYQGRVVAGASVGWFNLNASGAPSRSAGWHQFVIERHSDGTTVDFYVDGVLGRTITGVALSSLDSAAIGSTGSASTTGEAWIDDVKVEYFDLPVISTQPTSQTATAGATAHFSVGAVNTVGAYQWRKNGINLVNSGNVSGANTAALTVSNVQGSDAATYDVVVSNGAGPVDSIDVTLRVAPMITSQPANSTNLPLSTATFTIVAAGQTPFSYQWRHNGTNLTDGGNILGAVSDTLTVNSVAPADAGSYSVVVTNVAGSATSGDALLVPVILPTVTTQPVGQSVAASANVTFTTSATGTPPLFYQWHLNGADISGATGTSYTRLNVQSADAGSYSVAVTNAAGMVASDDALLTVNTSPVLSAIADRKVHAGFSVLFTNTATDVDTNQTLAFSLDAGAPAGAIIDTNSGVFTWATTAADAGTTNSVTVRVTDSGSPALSDAKSFAITVGSALTVQSITSSNGTVTLTWSALDSKSYRVQYKAAFSDTNWSDLLPDVTASGTSASATDSTATAQRFYRIRVLD